MTVILADIGGTHARFACEVSGQLQHTTKIASADYSSFADGVAAYAAQHSLENKGDLYLAVAAHDDGHGAWHFSNSNKWVIRPAELARIGWNVRVLVMDFYASARGALALPPGKLIKIKDGLDTPRTKTILGPGTGLGLAYAISLPDGKIHIHETFGGRMLMASATDEQSDIVRLIRHAKGPDAVVECEDIVSGRGLPLLYRAVCEHRGRPAVFAAASEILKSASEPDVIETLRLFHEFFGLFIHHAVTTGHAYGGAYLDGGMIQRLQEAKLFDAANIIRFFDLPGAAVVERHIGQTPIWVVDDPYVALTGLQELKKNA